MAAQAGFVRTTTTRWPDTLHREITQHAASEGVTFAQYVREATVARWAWELGIKEFTADPDVGRRIEAGLRRIRLLLDELEGS